MKRILILLGFLVVLSACKDNRNLVNDNEFLILKEIDSYTETTYFLDVTLNEDDNTLHVVGEIVYVNDKIDFDELYLLIYPNAYSIDQENYNVDFAYFMINDIEYPVIYTGDDNTSIYIELDETLLEGENFTIMFDYTFDYWDIGRLRAEDNYYMTMFFYPFVAVYDDEGFNHDAYTFHGESYYNEIGDYFVSLNAPEEYLVAASGKVINESTKRNRTTTNYFLNDGRDFSFSASPDYIRYERTIDDIDFEIYALGALTNSEMENSFQYLRNSFRIYEDYVGEYTLDHFTLEYGKIYGMESTGVIYCSREIDETTVVHEVIHQWFYSMIGNDQSDDSFIDESLTTFVTGIYYYDLYGRDGADIYFGYRDSMQERLEQHWTDTYMTPMLRKVDEYGTEYGYIIYYQGPTMYRYYLDEFLDSDFMVMKQFLRAYYDEYNGKVVSLEELLDLLESETGVENTREWFELMLSGVQELENRP